MKNYTILDKQRQFLIEERVSLIRNRLYKYVCPIFTGDEKGDISLYGSSLLLKIDTKYFLITAAHVIAASKHRSLYLWGRGEIILLTKMTKSRIHITVSTSDDHYDDKVDLAHVQLVNDSSEILQEFSFLDVNDLEMNDIANENKTYITIGCPHSQTKSQYKKPIIDQRYLFHLSNVANESVYKELNIPPQAYLAIIYDRNKTVDFSGHHHKPPAPYGISGGGIWILPNKSLIDHTSEMGKLVGVALAYQAANNIILGIKISVVLEMIKFAHPELNDMIPSSNLLEVVLKNNVVV